MNPETLESLLQSPLVSILSLVLAVVGILLAAVFFIKSRRIKKARYSINNRTVIETSGSEITGLQVQYDGNQQDRITVSKVGIWNCGTEPIRPPDIATSCPLLIQVHPGADVLAADVIYTTEEANQFHLDAITPADGDMPTSIPFSFEFLDRKDGAVVQIVHTGPQSHPISITGKLIGGSSPEKIWFSHQRVAHITHMFAEPRNFIRIGGLSSFGLFVAGVVVAFSNPAGIALAIIGGLSILGYAIMAFEGGPREIADRMK